MGLLNCLSCGLKSFFDNQREDKLGVRLVRLEKTLILQLFTRIVLQLTSVASILLLPTVARDGIVFIAIPLLISFSMTAATFILIQSAVKRNVSDLKEAVPAYSLCIASETVVYALFITFSNLGLELTSTSVEIVIADGIVLYQCLFAVWLFMWLAAHVVLSFIQYFQVKKIYNLYLMSDASSFASDDDLKEIYKDCAPKKSSPPYSSETSNSYTASYYVQPTAPIYQQPTQGGYVVDSLYPVVDVELYEPPSKS
jgi:hypothetical protein